MKRQNSITLLDFTNFLRAGALLRYEGNWILAYGAPHLVSTSKSEDISVFFPPFFDIEEAKAYRFESEASISTPDFVKLCREYLESHGEVASFWPQVHWQEPDLNDFNKAFSQTQQLIGQGQIDKSVPCAFTVAQSTLPSAVLVKILLDLVDAPLNLHVYGFWHDGEGVVGASPEVLFEKRGTKVKTMALAGTLAKATESRGEQLLKDKKELHENSLVVEDIRNQLTPIGRVHVHPVAVIELPTLWHLMTEIDIQLEEEHFSVDLVRRLHPTPALGVAPRRFGWRWMREWPQQQFRRRFGAPFLMKVDTDHWMCLVAIRNLQWTRQQMIIGSGCGVVRESNLEREWLELFYKRESVKKIMGIKS